MKKTKLLTSLIALALVISLGACEAGDININVGDVTLGGDDSSDTSSTESSESTSGGDTTEETPSEPSEDSSSSSSTSEEPPAVTYTYSLEVENGDSLTLNYDEALETQQGVELSIKLVTTSSTGDVTKEDGNADNLTFTVSDPTVVTVSGLTVLPLKGGETSITIKWSEHDDATASVGVTVTDVTVYAPTSWADYITNEYDLGVIAGAFGDVALDDILPFSYELLTNSSYSFQNYYVSAESFRLMYSWPSDSNGLTNAWDTLLTDFGYVKVSSETSGAYTTVTYTLEGGYTVEIKYSTVGDWDLYLYPPEPEPEGPTSWADYFTDEYTQGVLNELFDGVALDDILPFYLEESGLQRCEPQPTLLRFNIEYYPEPSGLTETWVALLLADGWTETSDESSNEGTTETISFEKDGYTISIVIEWGYWDLYLYPRTTTGGDGENEDLKTAQAILDVVTQTSYLDWDAFHGESVDDWEETISEYLTTDEDGNAYGYVVSSEDSNTYYYYGGYKCVYNQAGAAQTPGVSYLDYENELDDYSSPLLSAHSLNLSNVDSYEINELSDGYELVITNGASSNAYGYGTEYVYTVDGEFNLIALGQYGPENVASPDLVGSYAEKISYADVEEALAATSFDPADFGLGEGEDEEPSGLTLADYIAALSDKGFNYGDGFYFSQQSLDMSSGLDYDSLEIEALSNDVGYASQGHYDVTSGYYASEFYSDGTTTYVYDSDDQQAADAGGLYGYWFYQYTLESYFEFDTITGQLNSLGEDADLTDSDNVITDSYLYLYAYASDYSAMVELYATYDENGITYLVYSYGTNTSSYAVVFYPTDTVTTPEWYVPTTGSSSLADLFNAALEGENYTIVLEITDYQSNETAYDPNAFSPYVQLEPLQDLWCKITYTTDAAVVEYYANYEEFLAGTVMDVEYYLNTDAGLDIFMVFYWYDVDTVYFQWTEEGLTWQDYLGSLFGLEDYFSNFVEGETTTTERGTEVSYTLDNLDEDFLEALINALVDNGNYWAWETGGIDEITDISCSYLVDSEIIEFVFVSDEYTYHDEENYCYYLEQTTIKVYVLDVGSSSTPEYTLAYDY